MRLMPSVSRKLRLAANPENLAEFAPENAIHADNFVLVGALAQGGLSNVWGAVTFAHDRIGMALAAAWRNEFAKTKAIPPRARSAPSS